MTDNSFPKLRISVLDACFLMGSDFWNLNKATNLLHFMKKY